MSFASGYISSGQAVVAYSAQIARNWSHFVSTIFEINIFLKWEHIQHWRYTDKFETEYLAYS